MRGIVLASCPEARKYHDVPEVIFHYTTPEGVLGVLKDEPVLWFSRFDCLNDASEKSYIGEVYKKAIDQLRFDDQMDREFLDFIQDVKHDYRSFYRLEGEDSSGTSFYAAERKVTPYICCFSKNPDSLPMWNYYTKGKHYEGYNIGLYHSELSKYNFRSMRVIYDEVDQIAILKHAIKGVYINYSENKHSVASCRDAVMRALADWSVQFKHPAFQHEEEVRIVYYEPDDTDGIEYEPQSIQYRQKNGIIIPYFELKIDRSQIQSITIGPLIQADVAEETLKAMLKHRGYLNVDIGRSMVPIRY